MSEQPTAPAENDPATSQQGDPAGEPLGAPGLKALQDERAARVAAEKAATALQAQLEEIERAKLSDLERAQADAEQARKDLADLSREAVRLRVANAKNVPADLVEFLTGDTEEEVAAKADLLMSRMNAPTTPRPDPSQGGQGGHATATPADAFAQFLTGQMDRR